MIRMAVADNAVPMPLDEFNELLVGRKLAPFELRLPVIKELSSPSGVVIVPELSEGLFEQISLVQPPIGFEQEIERTSAVCGQVGFMRQERVTLAFDEPSIFTRYSGVFTTPNLIQSGVQMSDHMEFIEDNRGLGCVGCEGMTKRLPHVHGGQLNSLASDLPHLPEEPVHILFGSTRNLTHPDGTFLFQIGDHDSVLMPLPDGDFVDTDGGEVLGRRMLDHKVPHVRGVHTPDLIPGEIVHLGDFSHRHSPALLADEPLEAFGEATGLGQPGERFLFHDLAVRTEYPSVFKLQVDSSAAGVQVPHPVNSPVVESSGRLVT